MQKYFSTIWRLWVLLKPFHKDFYLQLFFIIITQASGIFFIFLTSKLLDNIINKDFKLAFSIAVLFFVLRIVYIIIDQIADVHSFKRLEMWVQQYLQEYSFKNIFKLNPSQYQEDHSAIKIQVINRGEQSSERIINKILLELLPVIVQIFFSLLMILFYSKVIFLIVFISLMIVVFWSYTFAGYHRPFIKENMDNWDVFQKVRFEAFQHLYLIKIMSIVDKFSTKYMKDRKKILDYSIFVWMKSLNHGFKRRTFLTVSRNISTFYLVYQAYLGLITVGGIYAVWQYINNVYDQIQTIVRAMRDLPLNFVELEKYLAIIDKEPEFKEKGEYQFKDGDIRIENLNFKYPKSESYVLHNINMNIKRGQKVALVGHSGGGKTTITKLLLRAYDYHEGRIFINNIELHEIDSDSLRRSIGYVEQHVELFDDTVKNNILLSVEESKLKEWEKENIIDQKLEDVAKLTRIDQFYHRLGEEKFNTEIGERGIKLSGGERQRVGIARSIIRDPSILIFDEATSALDTVNEQFIKEAIDNVSKDRTSIIIAHRLSTVVDSDIIFVFDKGEIVDSGTHTHLLQNSLKYKELIEAQELH
ncbi:MAG: transporter ATP-binding protein [Patescibacteria group bacterium]|nr:transporter ATP-binding protein [Patescibacteria group bacterium]